MHEMFRPDFIDLLVISRLAYNNWMKIPVVLEDHFKTKVLTNPFSEDKMLIKIFKDLQAIFEKICMGVFW